MNPEPEARQLGEYRLKQLLSETPLCYTWLAEQISVSRVVLVDELKPGQSHLADSFLADIRAKASVDHPLVGSVYEAVSEPGSCFYAHELLHGITLAGRIQENLTLIPARLAHILRRVSEAHLQHEALAQATSPLGLDDIYQDQHGVIRLKNLAIAGPRTPDHTRRDILHLGQALMPLVAHGQPGSTRLLTLLSWMRGEGIEAPIDWAQTRDVCMQIEHQLADSISTLTATKAASLASRKIPVGMIALVTGIMLASIAVIALKLRPPVPSENPQIPLPDPVTVAAGTHPTHDGLENPLPAFRISAHEVTIGQYAEFLDTLDLLAKNNRYSTFDLADQPADKKSHEPSDWPAILAAAKSKGLWQNQVVTTDSPVSGVDWWDAAAYAEWKKARLPTQEEWFAALNLDHKAPATLPPGPWAPVTSQTGDRTPPGLIGMAGSVCEWTSTLAPNPANPLGKPLWVIIGGSFQKPASNALTREWTADRSLRRPDLGFRLVFDAP
jgi:hypothetical protein